VVLPDITINVRSSTGHFIVTYFASIYESNDRTVSPIYEHYVWWNEEYFEELKNY
jgi:hypothetical protein